MRIAMVSETWMPDINGVANTLSHLSGELIERGVRMQLVRPTPKVPGHADGMEAELQVPALSVPRYSDVQLGVAFPRKMRRLWQQAPPDVVYIATEGPLGWSALSAARRLGLPVTSGFHTNFDHYAGDYGMSWLKTPVGRVLRHFHNRTQATLVPTHQRARELSVQGYRNVRVLGRGIDASHFGPHRRDDELRRRWGVAEHQPVALHVGRLAQEKNLDLLVETFEAMQRVQPDLLPVLVGDGPQRSVLQERLPGALFTGFIDADSLAIHYASADIFIFPSRSETYGNVVTEAMASGLGVVAFDHAAATELIEHRHNGLSVAVKDDQAFVDAAVTLCQQPALWVQLGRAARERVEKLSWSRITDDYLAILNRTMELAHAKPHPSCI
ncbi:Glycosyltransferase involved in cell wall bisynthesis [Modicisalibacter ilicicola DSM 19980]|uniref:Glycosyltransferase involved in cell wall bisynthesis n=1 Tax=Modicisalibacter ilicicola DSM 19980 TaxID=1121942 RepID=A0A1M4X9P3_9GAMM|nr:glycosyltransferase family 1 protein [Halomonas ilicicola]SHE90240.1 Glycosyltransferase involved in cell wall bisynthesis [Halomonas ilicicola DSM 19980]